MRYWLGFLAALDLSDHGKPQYSKLVVTVILVAAIWQGTLTTSLSIAVIAAAYGKSVFLAFIQRTQVAVTEATSIVVERRKGLDYEPVP